MYTYPEMAVIGMMFLAIFLIGCGVGELIRWSCEKYKGNQKDQIASSLMAIFAGILLIASLVWLVKDNIHRIPFPAPQMEISDG